MFSAGVRAHYHASQLAGARICRRVLARLTDERLLARLQRRVGGVRAGSASFVYALGPIGRRLLDERHRYTEPSQLFLDHTLAVADAHIAIVQADRDGRLEDQELSERQPEVGTRKVPPQLCRERATSERSLQSVRKQLRNGN